MKKILGLKVVLNLTIAIMLIGGLVYSLGFGICLYLAREEVTTETHQKVELGIGNVQTYIDGQLARVEDVAYTLVSSKFGKTHRDGKGNDYVVIDPATYTIPSEEETFQLLEQFLEANPHICGMAIGFEPFLYPDTKGEYGFAAYVTNVSGETQRLSLGEIHDFHQKEWYKEAATSNKPCWSRPFRETSAGKVVACYSLPLHGLGNRLIGVLALDIDTEAFRQKCTEFSPFPGAEVTLTDRDFNYICHPDTSFILRSVSEVGNYASYEADEESVNRMMKHESGNFLVHKGTEQEALFYFAPIDRTLWTVAVECPIKDIYGNVERMKRDTTFIAAVSILVMIICFILMFRRIQAMTLKKVGMESELKIAGAIQMAMIPKLYPAFPDRKELDVYGFLRPAKDVGGDLYDYFIRDDKFFFCIGDVSGKGVPASLFMAVIRSLFRNVSLHCADSARIVSDLNAALTDGNIHSMFCTMFVGILDLKTGEMEYCNAGHNAPIVRRFTESGELDVHYTKPRTNLAVGIFEVFPYESERTVLKPGEAIFLYTDGVTEAENVKKELFGEERTLEALVRARHEKAITAKDFVDHVLAEVERHETGAEQSDDITMVVVEYKGCS